MNNPKTFLGRIRGELGIQSPVEILLDAAGEASLWAWIGIWLRVRWAGVLAWGVRKADQLHRWGKRSRQR